ncbi:hypothetical protein N7466_007107 [Penicillium verhagenii]|uniref:uncharacterized protein n=1 Tax=Penicillium verhagenii TaxID=1562060 RepID=UPI002544F73B|nr:uncharacterized protein N7466_007107 [Penicillium verhagenii]KAJ5928151.1 hypothetical protein N7466_007107 [Penicillium verhagenii]
MTKNLVSSCARRPLSEKFTERKTCVPNQVRVVGWGHLCTEHYLRREGRTGVFERQHPCPQSIWDLPSQHTQDGELPRQDDINFQPSSGL